jgi:hypothetical protein
MQKVADRVLILGGAGLVGVQIARRIAQELKPRLIVIASLYQREVRNVLNNLRREYPNVTFDGCWGNVFVRKELANKHREEILESMKRTSTFFDDVYRDKDAAFAQSQLANLISEYKPDIVVDSINTATAISYQDVYTGSLELCRILNEAETQNVEGHGHTYLLSKSDVKKIETLLVSQAIPQLIRHVQILHDAMVKAGTRLYLKVGTTGTGGMGLNIPYTHSEDKPSAMLMSKTAVAFAHTGLLFLLARTPGGPIVKEIKPAAMIGYRKVDYRAIRRGDHGVAEYEAEKVQLGTYLDLKRQHGYLECGELQMVGVDTGENGFFTLGEFETITSLYQMEFLTPEEIAQNVVLEIEGRNTGKDVIAAIDGSLMDPSYRAGYLRSTVLEDMRDLEKKKKSHSVALGQLGPPELSKLLYEAYLLKLKFKTLEHVLQVTPQEISNTLYTFLRRNPIRNTIVSIGVPILLPDGRSLWRGPTLNIPEYRGEYKIKCNKRNIDTWAQKGWVDLRSTNMAFWQERFKEMIRSSASMSHEGSSAVTRQTYISDEIMIGDVVAWIFNNDPDILGFRIKAL